MEGQQGRGFWVGFGTARSRDCQREFWERKWLRKSGNQGRLVGDPPERAALAC